MTPLEQQKRKRDQAWQRLMQQYDRQQRANDVLAQQEIDAQRTAALEQGEGASGTGLAKGFSTGAAFGPVGGAVGAGLGALGGMGQTYEAYKKDPNYAKDKFGATGVEWFDAFVNPLTTAPNIGKGLFQQGGAETAAAGIGELYKQNQGKKAFAPYDVGADYGGLGGVAMDPEERALERAEEERRRKAKGGWEGGGNFGGLKARHQ